MAFTPPMHTTISAEPAAARRAERPRISGSTAHGASTPGSTAADVEPTRMVKVGHSANAAPASSRVAARSDPERLGQPDQPEERHRHEQRHPEPFGHPDRHVQRVRGQIEQAHREGVADVLVLQAAQPLQRIPQVPQPLVEADRVDVDPELGVEGHLPRVLDSHGGQGQAPDQRGPLTAGLLRGVGPAVPQPGWQPRGRPPPAAACRARRGPGDLLGGELYGRHACRRRITSRVPGQQLTQAGEQQDEPAPARVVPGPGLGHGDVGPAADERPGSGRR